MRVIFKHVGQLPGMRRFMSVLWNTYECIKFAYYIWKNGRSNNSYVSIDPFQLYWVPTESVNKMSYSSFDFIKDTGRIVGGIWDKNHKNVEDGNLYQNFKQFFHRGESWDKNRYYNRRIQKIKTGSKTRYANIRQVDEKFEQYEKMFEMFKKEEYKLQSEIVSDEIAVSVGDGGQAFWPSLCNKLSIRHEICVNIGRDGALLRNDGRHRLALALLAGLDEVPVRIVVRHTEWQQLRDMVAQTIDEGLDNGVPAAQMHNHVEQTIADELGPVSLGLDHPDLAIIFERRLPSS